MNLDEVNKIQRLAEKKGFSPRVVHDQDGVSIHIRGRRKSTMTEMGAKELQAELQREGFDVSKKMTGEGWLVMVL